ncbi:hypothetical protein SVIO_001070 [Streptomyces violaceusniger]|uniref:Mutator family transposase n=1 Tax=Streptomyces violaceusniger TaxID=68280 RepID=A0A4D4KMQ9_STRVO|nr:hypothetical protein SVIO_001070 [Streptomyces violaceusniger]
MSFLRNVFAMIPKDAAEMVAATIRTIFAQPTAEAVRAQFDTVADMLGRQFPEVKAMLLEAKADLTAFADFPERHWKKIQSTNPLGGRGRAAAAFAKPDAGPRTSGGTSPARPGRSGGARPVPPETRVAEPGPGARQGDCDRDRRR